MARKQKMPALTQKWVEALRSGKYAQTNGCLKDDSGFCCLGVAADVIAPSQWLKTKDDQGHYRFRNQKNDAYLPIEDWNRLIPKNLKIKNKEYSGDDWDSEFYEFEPSQEEMAELNDSKNLNFNEIADIIETWWTDNPIDPDDFYSVREFLENKNK